MYDVKGHARILRLKYNLRSFTYFWCTVGIWIPGFLWSGFLLINSCDRFYEDEKLCLLNKCKLIKIKSHMIMSKFWHSIQMPFKIWTIRRFNHFCVLIPSVVLACPGHPSFGLKFHKRKVKTRNKPSLNWFLLISFLPLNIIRTQTSPIKDRGTFLYSCYSLSTEPQGPHEGTTV